MEIFELDIDDYRYRVTTEGDGYAVVRVDENRRVGRFTVERDGDGTLHPRMDAEDAALERIAQELIAHGWVIPVDDR